ncbi:hypothetical protein [Haloferula sp.]|uniref:hypothetical protein n=1 Tax=Haloferula sp. TaxID=2497595 RepID=UPI00329A97CB
MKRVRRQIRWAAGISLVETIVSVGVLAVVIPLAFAAMLKASDTGASGRAETRAPAIADFCMVELRAAREGDAIYFAPIKKGTDFGNGADFMGLGFGRDGSVIGEVSESEYETGVEMIGGKRVFFLAKVSGKLDTETREVDLVTVTVSVEYPATKSATRRSKANFHTKLP